MLTWLAELPGAFHLFRYLTFRTLGAARIGLFLRLLLRVRNGGFISALRLKRGKGQPIRAGWAGLASSHQEGHADHGRALILSACLSPLSCGPGAKAHLYGRAVRLHWLAVVGLCDDYLKVAKHLQRHLPSRQAILPVVIAALACYAVLRIHPEGEPALAVPFMKRLRVDLGWAPCCSTRLSLSLSATRSMSPIGLDGLAIVPVMIAAPTRGSSPISPATILSALPSHRSCAIYWRSHGRLRRARRPRPRLLWYNSPPAQIFMGDTGSLAPGGLLGTIAFTVQHEVVLAVIGGLFVMEPASVVIQVVSFTLTGRRVFLVAPNHIISSSSGGRRRRS